MTVLSVNLNKIALLRNSREGQRPSVVEFARQAITAGAEGITVHPRPDQRHIRASDVPLLATMLKTEYPHIEFNIEGKETATLNAAKTRYTRLIFLHGMMHQYDVCRPVLRGSHTFFCVCDTCRAWQPTTDPGRASAT